jgi:predicted CXXCH cytochrome family protein
LYVDVQTYSQSVHGDWLDCVNCHESNRRYPHPLLEVSSRRDYTQVQYELCKRCHFDNYTRTLDSVHFGAMAEGDVTAPVCTDCHTAHTVGRLEESRTDIAQTCAKCHADIYEEYSQSIHGAALEAENPDVPVCTTCHGVHDIASATTPAFWLGSVGLCAECHAKKELMDKYGISSRVLKTYLDDFHGKTVGFYQEQTSEVWPEVAVCADYHGVHDIRSIEDPESQVIKENLLTTCSRCHPEATANFPSAWLSHYEPSPDKAPLVFFVKEYYRLLIPLMIGGLALNIVLDLWRLARNR